MRRATAIGAGLGLLLASSACTDRLIREHRCGDGIAAAGELCLGRAGRDTLTVEGLTPLSLRLAEFDGEPGPDLLVMGLDIITGAVAGRLWRGDRAGGFSADVDPEVFGCSAYPVPGTLDDDDIDDLLVDDCETSVSLFRGGRSGVFDPPLTVRTGALTRSSGLLDLDDDGRREVVLYGSTLDDVLVLSVSESDHSGAFAPPVVSPLSGLAPEFVPGGFGIFDVDGDPFPDALLVHGGRPDGLAVATGEDGLRFAPPRRLDAAGLTPGWAVARDLDGDGRREVLLASFEEHALVTFDAADGALRERARTDVPGLGPGLIALADLDDDGRLDLLRVSAEPTRVDVWLGLPGGRFSGPTPVELGVPVDQLAFADLDDDGALDLVVGSFESSSVHVWLSDP